jgi:hypothetical protein
MSTGKAIRKAVVLVLFNAVMVAVIGELVLIVALRAPRLVGVAPRPFRGLVQQVYRHFDRALIQYEPSCARYDPEVTYTLRPGGCTFGNAEFTNQYGVNRLGLRDNDADLERPEVIVLGDSHAMGWGVDQDETLVRVLARTTGRKTLDAAVSSYGTVREMRLLDRLDATALKVLVIQYCDNDLPENLIFRRQGGHLPIMSQAQYEKIQRYYAAQRRYFPGKYLFRLFMKVTRLEEPEPVDLSMPPATPTEEAQHFLNALMRASRTPLDHVQVVVFEANQQIRPGRPFIAALDQVRRREEYPPFVRQLLTLDIAPLLTPADFYVVDDHMNPHGHQVVGEALAALINAHAGQ